MRRVRYVTDFDWKPHRMETRVRKEGDELEVTEAEFKAASERGAVEVIDGEDQEQGQALAQADQAAGGSEAEAGAGDRRKRR